MGKILNFEPAAQYLPRMRIDPPPGGATILFFTGVRYEQQASSPSAPDSSAGGSRDGGDKGARAKPSPRTAPRRRA